MIAFCDQCNNETILRPMVASMFTAAADAVADAVVALRKRKGWSQRQLAKALGREQNYVARIETAQRRVDLVEWITLCRSCDADPVKETTRLLKSITVLVPQSRPRR